MLYVGQDESGFPKRCAEEYTESIGFQSDYKTPGNVASNLMNDILLITYER